MLSFSKVLHACTMVFEPLCGQHLLWKWSVLNVSNPSQRDLLGCLLLSTKVASKSIRRMSYVAGQPDSSQLMGERAAPEEQLGTQSSLGSLVQQASSPRLSDVDKEGFQDTLQQRVDIQKPQYLADLDLAEEAERKLASGSELEGVASNSEAPSKPIQNLR